jgi:glycosyltransferase involved in cell wall biosynthesis
LESLYLEAVDAHGVPDILHAHVCMPAGYGASMLGVKYNVPVIVTEHYSGFFSDFKFPWRIGCYYQKMRKKLSGFYVVSPGFKKNIETKTNVEVDGVLPNPINTDLFSPQPRKDSKRTSLQLITTGNVGRIKGTDILLEAVNSLPDSLDWQLTIVGAEPQDGNDWKLLKHPKVKLLPRQSQLELAGLYSKSDIFIVSSRIETANVSMLEAMACGCFVITSKIGAPESLLDNTVSSVFESENYHQLANRIINIPEFERTEQRKYVENLYSEQSVFASLKDNYSSVIRNFKENMAREV